MLEDHFKVVAGEKFTSGLKACRIMKFDMKGYLKENYDTRLYPRFMALFDFTIPAFDYNRYCDRFE